MVAATVVTLLGGLISLKGFVSKFFTPYSFWFGQQSELLFKKSGPSHHFLSSLSFEALHPRDAMSAGFWSVATYFHAPGVTSFLISTTRFCTNGLNSLWLLVIQHNAISESSQQTQLFIFRDRSSALRTLKINIASTNADSSSNLGVVAPVMGDTLVYEATRLHTTELPDFILR